MREIKMAKIRNCPLSQTPSLSRDKQAEGLSIYKGGLIASPIDRGAKRERNKKRIVM